MAEIKPCAWMGVNPNGERHYTSYAYEAVKWEEAGIEVVPLCRHKNAAMEINALSRDNASFIEANTDLVSEVETLRQQLADERNKAMEDAASGLEKCNTNGLERRICCDGYMCGCHGSTVAEYAAHCVRSMKDKP